MKPLPQEKVIPSALKQAREEKHYDQVSFGELLSKKIGLKQPVAAAAISMWECGKRYVPTKYIDAICDILEIKREDLVKQPTSRANDDMFSVPWSQIDLYDNKPLYLHFENYDFPDSWAIVDTVKRRFVFKDKVMPFPNQFQGILLMSLEPTQNIPDDVSQNALSLAGIMKEVMIYVTMKTSDKTVQTMYNGWYHHNENKSALINSNGLVLPYEGINVSYIAHKSIEKVMI